MEGATTKIKHIYSHVEDKLRQANANGKKGKLIVERIEKQKMKYGEQWDMHKKGNEAADKLTGGKDAISKILGNIMGPG